MNGSFVAFVVIYPCVGTLARGPSPVAPAGQWRLSSNIINSHWLRERRWHSSTIVYHFTSYGNVKMGARGYFRHVIGNKLSVLQAWDPVRLLPLVICLVLSWLFASSMRKWASIIRPTLAVAVQLYGLEFHTLKSFAKARIIFSKNSSTISMTLNIDHLR